MRRGKKPLMWKVTQSPEIALLFPAKKTMETAEAADIMRKAVAWESIVPMMTQSVANFAQPMAVPQTLKGASRQHVTRATETSKEKNFFGWCQSPRTCFALTTDIIHF